MWGDFIPKDLPVEGPNERCIEVPLALEVLQLTLPGRVLDAGCALNGHLQEQMLARVFHLTQNAASEKTFAHSRAPLSYVSADLRDLSVFAGAAFDRTVCVSTLEHVGMDNTTYAGPVEHCPETMLKAVKELCRVTRSTLLITVPYTDPARSCKEWRYMDQQTLGHMARIACNFGFQVEIRYYAKCDGGWYGGDTKPVEASTKDYPETVNAIACLRCQQ